MRLATPGAPHLTYCTNIHAGESWAEVKKNLETHVVGVKARVAADRPFGVGLRLSGRAAIELGAPGELEALRGFLADRGLYVFTINGFPHGAFHGEAVKERVYLPDWLDEERLVYTDRLAEILASTLPEDPSLEGTISTVPGAFRARASTDSAMRAMAERLVRQAALLVRLYDRTGRRVALALEPEPECVLETAYDAASFFERWVFAPEAIERFEHDAGLAGGSAEEALRRHLGVCLDACHMAVEFEDFDGALARLRSAGVRVAKIQLSAGLEARFDVASNAAMLEALERFAEGVYLHQVTESRGGDGAGELRKWIDLPEALRDATAETSRERTWRIHFHVPLFREELGPFRGTQPYLAKVLARVADEPISPHLEVETYTWDVLPEEHRRAPIVEAVARELDWVTKTLATEANRP